MGATVTEVDPKCEAQRKYQEGIEYLQSRGVETRYLEEFIETFNFITLSSSEEDRGKLDVLIILSDTEQKITEGKSILESLGGVTLSQHMLRAAISEAVKKAASEGCGLLRAVELLFKSNEDVIKHLGATLRSIASTGIGKLLFAYKQANQIKVKKVNIIQFNNLKLPDKDKNIQDYTDSEITASTIMKVVTMFAIDIAKKYEGLKQTTLEEAHSIFRSQDGNTMVSDTLRTGRSLKSALYLVTQSTKDLNESYIREQIGVKFAFKADDTEEIERILDYFSLPDTSFNRELIANLDNGECLMEDVYGRHAKIKIDVIFSEWLQLFNTAERAKERMLGEGVS